MNQAVETEAYKGHVIKIYRDEDAESPRDWDNLGIMTCAHRRYNLGDYKDHKFPHEQYSGWSEYEDELEKQGAVYLPLYLLDHSGITMSTRDFNDPWDSGRVGFIYATPDMIRKWFGVKRLSQKVRARALKALQGEVETYDQYLRGEVYGYEIEDKDGVVVDSLYGIYGLNYALEEAKAIVDHHERRMGKLEA